MQRLFDQLIDVAKHEIRNPTLELTRQLLAMCEIAEDEHGPVVACLDVSLVSNSRPSKSTLNTISWPSMSITKLRSPRYIVSPDSISRLNRLGLSLDIHQYISGGKLS